MYTQVVLQKQQAEYKFRHAKQTREKQAALVGDF